MRTTSEASRLSRAVLRFVERRGRLLATQPGRINDGDPPTECAATFRLEETCPDEVTMKGLHLAPFAAFAMLAACSADVPNPLVPISEQASLVPKPGAHFQRADAELSGANLVVSFREVGLGEGDVTVVASADATADYACLNRGGEFPNDPKKQSLSGPVSATGVFPVAKNGHIEGTLTVLPPASTLECPGGQTVVMTAVSYTNVTVTDVTNETSIAVPGTFSEVFFSPVP